MKLTKHCLYLLSDDGSIDAGPHMRESLCEMYDTREEAEKAQSGYPRRGVHAIIREEEIDEQDYRLYREEQEYIERENAKYEHLLPEYTLLNPDGMDFDSDDFYDKDDAETKEAIEGFIRDTYKGLSVADMRAWSMEEAMYYIQASYERDETFKRYFPSRRSLPLEPDYVYTSIRALIEREHPELLNQDAQ